MSKNGSFNKYRKKEREERRESLLKSGKLSDKEKILILTGKINALEAEVRDGIAEQFTATEIKSKIFEIAEHKIIAPDWLVKPKTSDSKTLGIPTIFASDWHYGEVVEESEIGYSNKFNLEIADKRIQNLVNNSLDVLFNHLSKPHYEGLVFPLGGDMFSGDIHDELSRTNELPMFPTLLRLTGRLAWAIKIFADKFGRVHIPVVAGNHGRTTRKPSYKHRAFENYDWLLGCMLAREFKNDKRITFQIPDGMDARYSIYGHRYNLTHGDQFSGGDSIIGAIGTVLRGDSKKRNRESQLDRPYDTLLCGHFHQLWIVNRAIINGTLKGYDEYAYGHNFPFEEPKQAMWLTHPNHGITFNMPIFVDKTPKKTFAKPLEF